MRHPPQPDTRRFGLWIITATIVLLIAASTAFADTYPISGKWTYDNPRAEGPAKDCGTRYMSFEGDQRRDTGGSIPAYRNFSIVQNGDTDFQVTDQFNNAMVNARQSYRLKLIDDDHIEIDLSAGPVIRLRRCE